MKPSFKPVAQPVAKAAPPVVWTLEQWQAQVPAVLAATGVSASPEQVERLSAYMALLQRWNATYNLTALRGPQDMLSHHLADCLVVVAPMLQHLAERGLAAGARLLDVGSGGGLPGVVLAILCPQVQVTCVDTVGKKAAFIRQVAAELRLPNLKGEHARVERLTGHFDLITSRAFASLVDFTDWTVHLLAPGAGWMAMKGRAPDDERQALSRSVSVEAVVPLHVPGLEAERCLVWMRPMPL